MYFAKLMIPGYTGTTATDLSYDSPRFVQHSLCCSVTCSYFNICRIVSLVPQNQERKLEVSSLPCELPGDGPTARSARTGIRSRRWWWSTADLQGSIPVWSTGLAGPLSRVVPDGCVWSLQVLWQ